MQTQQPRSSSSVSGLTNPFVVGSICFVALFLSTVVETRSIPIAVLTTAAAIASLVLLIESYRLVVLQKYRWWRVLVAILVILSSIYLMAWIVLVSADSSLGNILWGATDPVDAFGRWSWMSKNLFSVIWQMIEVMYGLREATFTTSAGVREFLWAVMLTRLMVYVLISALVLHVAGWIIRARRRG